MRVAASRWLAFEDAVGSGAEGIRHEHGGTTAHVNVKWNPPEAWSELDGAKFGGEAADTSPRT